MTTIKYLLSHNHFKIYVQAKNNALAKAFLKDAEAEGFKFTAGTKPTSHHPSDLFAVNSDMTISYVGIAGRLACQCGAQVGGQNVIKINYEI